MHIIEVTQKNQFQVQVGRHVHIIFSHHGDKKENDFWAMITQVDDDQIHYVRDDGWEGNEAINYFPKHNLWCDLHCHIDWVKEVQFDTYVCKPPVRIHWGKSILNCMLMHEQDRWNQEKKKYISNIPHKIRMLPIFSGYAERVAQMPLVVKEHHDMHDEGNGKVSAWSLLTLFMMAGVYTTVSESNISWEKAIDVWRKQNCPHAVYLEKTNGYNGPVTVCWKRFVKWFIANQHRFLMSKKEMRAIQKEIDEMDEKDYAASCKLESERNDDLYYSTEENDDLGYSIQ